MKCEVGQILDDRYVVLAVKRDGYPFLIFADGRKIVFDSYNAIHLAEKFGPSFWLKKAACTEPNAAVHYAENIQKKPDDMTRDASLGSPRHAFAYAKHVDKGPNDLTRIAASRLPECAFDYMVKIDKNFHMVTWAGACEERQWKHEYEKFLKNSSIANVGQSFWK